jgi:hypothetical protein
MVRYLAVTEGPLRLVHKEKSCTTMLGWYNSGCRKKAAVGEMSPLRSMSTCEQG